MGRVVFSLCVAMAAKWEQAKITEGTLKGTETNHRNESVLVQVILGGPDFPEISREELDYQCGYFINDLFCLGGVSSAVTSQGVRVSSSAVTSQGVRVRAEFASFTRMLFFLAVYIYHFWSAACFGVVVGELSELALWTTWSAAGGLSDSSQAAFDIHHFSCCRNVSKTFAGCRVKKFSVDSASELHRGHVCIFTSCQLAMFDLQVLTDLTEAVYLSSPTNVNTISWATSSLQLFTIYY